MAKSIPYSERKFDRENASRYNAKFKKENYDRIELLLPKGYKENIKKAASEKGTSMNDYIRMIIDEKIN